MLSIFLCTMLTALSVYVLTGSSPNCSSSAYYVLDQTNVDLIFNLNIFRYFQDADFFKTFNILLDIFNYKRVERVMLKTYVQCQK